MNHRPHEDPPPQENPESDQLSLFPDVSSQDSYSPNHAPPLLTTSMTKDRFHPYRSMDDPVDIPRDPVELSSPKREIHLRQEFPPPRGNFSNWGLPLLLFILTVFTTLWAGAYQSVKYQLGAWEFLRDNPHLLVNGLSFSVTLLGILVIHELGHYVLSRIHKVPSTFPLFIPGPPHLIGTFGAVIRLRSPIMYRRALFDIGVAGPIAGFVAAVMALIVGLSKSSMILKEQAFGLQLGEPLLLQFFAWLAFGPLPPTHDIVLHPIAFAAWLGFFVTAINLLPLGQLDGGHVAFAVLGSGQRTLALALIPVLFYMGLTGWPGWLLWVGLAFIVGIGHPPVRDPDVSLGRGRLFVAWIALGIFIVSFAPIPFYIG